MNIKDSYKHGNGEKCVVRDITLITSGEGTAAKTTGIKITRADASLTEENLSFGTIDAVASSADKLNTNAGSSTQPVYFENGVPVAITGAIANDTTGKAASADKINTDAGSATLPVYFTNGVPVAITSYEGNAATATTAKSLATKINVTVKDNTSVNSQENANIDWSGNTNLLLPSTIVADITGDVSGNSGTTTKLQNAITVTVKDSTSEHSKDNTAIDWSGATTLNLPDTIKASIIGNVEGNVSGNAGGSSSSCTGNAATASNLSITNSKGVLYQSKDNVTSVTKPTSNSEYLTGNTDGSLSWATAISSFGEQTGAITVRGGLTTKGSINLAMNDKELQASIVGLGSAAYKSTTASITEGSTSLPTSGAVYTAINDGIAKADAMVYKGTISGSASSTNTNKVYTPAADKGHTYKVDIGGTINGITVEAGDMLICNTDNTAAATADTYDKAPIKDSWDFIQANLDPATFITKATFEKANQLMYSSAAGAPALLDSNSEATKKFLSTASSGAPAWSALASSDIPNLNASKITEGQLAVAQGGTGVATANANVIFAGPSTGTAAAPSFRSLVAADIPSLSATKITSDLIALANGGTGVNNTSITKNTVFAGPSAADGSASFRALVANDIPSLSIDKLTSGTLSVERGGTGAGSFTSNAIIVGNGTRNLGSVATAAGAAYATAKNGTLTFGTLRTSYGGTGKTTWTLYGLVYASSTSALALVAIGDAGQCLIVNSDKTGYVWATRGTVTSITPGTGLTGTSSDTAITTTGTINLLAAQTEEIGGVKAYKVYKNTTAYSVTAKTSNITGDITTGNYYGVELDKDDKAFVYVPALSKWTSSSDNNDRYLAFSPASITSDSDYLNYYNASLKYNPSTGNLLSTKFNGYVLGNACAATVKAIPVVSALDNTPAPFVPSSTGTGLISERVLKLAFEGEFANNSVYAIENFGDLNYTLTSSSWTSSCTKVAEGLGETTLSEISIKGKESGTYVILILDKTYNTMFSGIFSVYKSNFLTNNLDEIPLHMNSSAAANSRIYAATQNGKIVFSCNEAGQLVEGTKVHSAHKLNVTIKRLI